MSLARLQQLRAALHARHSRAEKTLLTPTDDASRDDDVTKETRTCNPYAPVFIALPFWSSMTLSFGLGDHSRWFSNIP